MNDLIWIVLQAMSITAFLFFIYCENKNTKARKEQIKELKKQNKMLDELIRRKINEQKNKTIK